MTDNPNLPAVFGDLERRERAEGGLRPLREALAAAGAQAARLADEHDIEALGYGLVQLKAVAADLRTLVDDVTQLVVREAPTNERGYYEPFTIDGVANFEVLRKGANRKWSSEDLLRRVVLQAMVDPETGELPTDAEREVAERVVTALAKVVPFTGSLGWRVTALKEMGIDPDEWAETTRPEGYSLKITGQEK